MSVEEDGFLIRSDRLVPIPDPTELTIDALDRAITAALELIQSKLDAHGVHSQARIDHIHSQFRKVEEQRREQKTDSKEAIDAALAAQEKAILKTETAFNSALAAQDAALTNLTERVVRVESVRLGQQEQKHESRAITGTTIAVIALAVSMVVGFASIIGFLAGNL